MICYFDGLGDVNSFMSMCKKTIGKRVVSKIV